MMITHEVAPGSVGRSDALLTYMQDLLAVLNEAGAIAYASPSYQAILGYAPTTLLNAALLDYVHADDQVAVRDALTSARAQEDTPAIASYRHRHADGSWRTIQATLHNRLADPALGGIVAVGRDITPLQEDQAQAATATARLRALQEVTDAALAHLSLDAVLRAVLERTTQVLGVDNTAILLLDEAAQVLVLHVAHGPEEEVAGQVRVPLGQGIAGRIAATGEPLIVDDMAQAEAVNPFLREHIRSLLGVPLRLNGRRIGVLHVGTLAPHRFTAEDLQWLQLVGDRVALAIAHADLYEAERGARERASAQAGELAAIFEAIGDPVLVYDREGRLLRTNAAAQALNRRIQQPGYADIPYAERVSLSL